MFLRLLFSVTLKRSAVVNFGLLVERLDFSAKNIFLFFRCAPVFIISVTLKCNAVGNFGLKV